MRVAPSLTIVAS